MGGDVIRTVEGAVCTLTLNLPERMNATTFPMVDEFFDLLDYADADPAVQVIVVTGAGRGFCAGWIRSRWWSPPPAYDVWSAVDGR